MPFFNPFAEYNDSAIVYIGNSLSYTKQSKNVAILGDINDSIFAVLSRLKKRERAYLKEEPRIYRARLQYHPKEDISFLWGFDLNGPSTPEKRERKATTFSSGLQEAVLKT